MALIHLAAVVSLLTTANEPAGTQQEKQPQLVGVDSVRFKEPVTGTLLVEILYDRQRDESFIIVANATKERSELLNVVGPVRTLEDWATVYDKMDAFARVRPGGYFCSTPSSGCVRNVLITDARARSLKPARAPFPPSPPPPDITGYTSLRELPAGTAPASSENIQAALQRAAQMQNVASLSGRSGNATLATARGAEIRLVSVSAAAFREPRLGSLLVQILYDRHLDQSFVVVATATDGKAELLNVVGPVKTLEDWTVLYDKMSSFAKLRPGGHFCSTAGSPCSKNVLVSEPRARGLSIARSPKTPSPPPPDITVVTSIGELPNGNTPTSPQVIDGVLEKVSRISKTAAE